MVRARGAGYWQDWVNLGLGGWLMLWPWLFADSGMAAVAWNAWAAGFAVAILALVAILRFAGWTETAITLLGLWLVASPWILGGPALRPEPYWGFVISGILIAGLASWNWAEHRALPRGSV